MTAVEPTKTDDLNPNAPKHPDGRPMTKEEMAQRGIAPHKDIDDPVPPPNYENDKSKK